MDNRPIGVFDSGVGGLTVVKQIIRKMPHEDIVYFGDTARLPYGSKSKETVIKFSKQIINFLLKKDVKAVVIACNTASSNALEDLKETYRGLPIFGVVEPGASDAIKYTKNKCVGVIGTAATVRSGAYEKLINELDNNIKVFSKACPLFVPLVEENWGETDVAYITAKMYLEELVNIGIDSLVLGCTHYPFMKKCIGETVGDNIKLVDPAYSAASKVKEFLENNDMLNSIDKYGEKLFYLSDITDMFDSICKRALKESYIPQKVDIEKYASIT